jgi:DNA polymerase-3 subunit chi
MTRIDYYYNVLNKVRTSGILAAKALNGAECVLIYTLNPVLAKSIDDYLWLSNVSGFVPHVLTGHVNAKHSPVVIGSDVPHNFKCNIMINLESISPVWFSRFDRFLDIVDDDLESKELARIRYKFFKDNGYSIQVHDLRCVA